MILIDCIKVLSSRGIVSSTLGQPYSGRASSVFQCLFQNLRVRKVVNLTKTTQVESGRESNSSLQI